MLGLVTVALIVIGVAGSTLLQRYLLARVDNQLRTTANQIIRDGRVSPDSNGRYGVYPGGGLYVADTDSDGTNLVSPRHLRPSDSTASSEAPAT